MGTALHRQGYTPELVERSTGRQYKLEELLDEYFQATGLGAEPGSLLFPAAERKTGKLSCRRLARTDDADMLKLKGGSNKIGAPGVLFAALVPGDRNHQFPRE